MIVFAPTALLATSRASSSRPATTRPGRPLSNHLVAACRARGCLPPSTLALHNVPTRRARRGPGRAGAAAARRAVLLFPRGRRAFLSRVAGVGELRCCGEQLFLWSALRGPVAPRTVVHLLLVVGAAYGLLQLKRNRPCPSLYAQMRRCAAAGRPRWTPASRRTRPLPGVSRSNQTRSKHARDGSVSCGL